MGCGVAYWKEMNVTGLRMQKGKLKERGSGKKRTAHIITSYGAHKRKKW
jgi:hypothetical protein